MSTHAPQSRSRRGEARALGTLHGLSPLRVLVASFTVFFALLLLAPVKPDIVYSMAAPAFLLISILAALVGVQLAAPKRTSLRMVSVDTRCFAWNVATKRCVCLASAGLILAIIDRFAIRGVSLGADLFEARNTIEEAGAGPVAVVAAFLSSFSAFGLVNVWLARSFHQPVSRLVASAAIINLVVYVGLSVMLGSRSLLLACVLLHLCTFRYLRRFEGRKLGRGPLLGMAAIALIVVVVMAEMLRQRLELMELSAIDSIQLSIYALTLKPTAGVLEFLVRNDFLESFGAATYSLILYVFHGFYEFLLLFDSYAGESTFGEQLLWLPIKLLRLIVPIREAIDLEQFAGYRSGVFTTFAGPFFIDFGLWAPLLIVPTFAFLAIPYRRVAAGDLRWLPAALQVIVILILAPVMALLQSAVGTYLLVASVFMVALTPKHPIRHRSVRA